MRAIPAPVQMVPHVIHLQGATSTAHVHMGTLAGCARPTVNIILFT